MNGPEVRAVVVGVISRHAGVLVAESCDGCGFVATTSCQLVAVAIEVNAGEEMGRRDEYDYCDDCLIERAPLLVAAGSRAELVTGEEPPADEEDA